MSQQISVPTARRLPGFDPIAQPVLPCDPLPVLPAASLQLSSIRRAFERPVPWKVEPRFVHDFSPSCRTDSGIREAAVLVPIVQRSDELHVLLTRRADHLQHHAGQVSFPGGCIEPEDQGPIAAAIRETHEEIGIERRFVRVMGAQPSLLTTTRFLMTPVVGEILPGFHVLPDASEVAEVFEVPLSVLLDPRRHVLHQLQVEQGVGRCYFSIRWHSYFIWGATAALIRNLYHFLAAVAAQEAQYPEGGSAADHPGNEQGPLSESGLG